MFLLTSFALQKFNRFGRFLSVITVNGYSRSIIIIPENKANEEWLGIVNRIESFVNRGSLKHGYAPVPGDLKHQFLRGEDNYKEALQKNRWTAQEPTILNEQKILKASTSHDEKDLLNKCLIGSFPECDDIPTRSEVRRWAQQVWKGVFNFQIFDMNGIQFLSREDAEHIVLGNWKRQGKQLVLDWWSPTVGAFPTHHKFVWFGLESSAFLCNSGRPKSLKK